MPVMTQDLMDSITDRLEDSRHYSVLSALNVIESDIREQIGSTSATFSHTPYKKPDTNVSVEVSEWRRRIEYTITHTAYEWESRFEYRCTLEDLFASANGVVKQLGVVQALRYLQIERNHPVKVALAAPNNTLWRLL